MEDACAVAELWMQAMAGGAEVVFWGSAYGGGNPLRSAAMMHNYAIVSSGCKTQLRRTIIAGVWAAFFQEQQQ